MSGEQVRYRGQTVLRLAFLNPETDPQRVIAVLEELKG